ncbi:MAG: dihydroorotase [Clostridia bacterium]|nr:dihydroorotase [Clostridia bacterium]
MERIEQRTTLKEGTAKAPGFDFSAPVRESADECVKKGYTVLPGFCDVHVHFREPGFSYKETIKTGSEAAAAGGFTDVCTMPNLDPVPDSLENIKKQLEIIERDAVIRVHPYASITLGRAGMSVVDMEALAPYAAAFSDDGSGVQADGVMEQAMIAAKACGKLIAAHCEDNSLLDGGYVHQGEYAVLKNHRGISSESEWRQIERDLQIAAKTGCAYHVCHISTKESVSLIREAKKSGVDVTCETAPHYLLLDDMDMREDGRFKMNPPLRSAKDREALVEGVADGTVDMIATDHAPHSSEEKSKGLKDSAFGIVGLETSFPVLYTELVRNRVITLDRLVYMMSEAPRRRFGIPAADDFSAWALDETFTVDPKSFRSLGRSTPFAGRRLYGVCKMTVCGGKTVFKAE